MTDTWTPEAARERLKIGLEYDPDGLISYSVDLMHALDRVAELEARGAASLRVGGRMRPLPYLLDESELMEEE